MKRGMSPFQEFLTEYIENLEGGISELDRRLGGTGVVYKWFGGRPNEKPSKPTDRYIEKLSILTGCPVREIKMLVHFGDHPNITGDEEVDALGRRLVRALLHIRRKSDRIELVKRFEHMVEETR